MDDSALGAIETFGLVPAIEAADAAVKSADVMLTGCRCVGAGLVTVLLSGDISAVKASVEAGEAAAKRLGPVISTTVIGRKAQGLDSIFHDPEVPPEIVSERTSEPTPEIPLKEAAERLPVQKATQETVSQGTTAAEDPLPSEKSLRKMKVTRLRALARTLGDGFSIERQKIKFARKQDLIREILAYYRKLS